MSEPKYELKKHTLGSGHLHIEEYNGEIPYEAEGHSWDEFFRKDGKVREDNLLGRIKGGASYEYSTEKYEDEDDLGFVKISEITKEKVVFKSGIMTWNPAVLAAVCATAKVTDLEDGTQIVEIGGLANNNDKRYILGFEHYSGKIRAIIVGHNTEGFNFDFKQDQATVVDCNFTAEAYNSEGRLLKLIDMRNKTEEPASVES